MRQENRFICLKGKETKKGMRDDGDINFVLFWSMLLKYDDNAAIMNYPSN